MSGERESASSFFQRLFTRPAVIETDARAAELAKLSPARLRAALHGDPFNRTPEVLGALLDRARWQFDRKPRKAFPLTTAVTEVIEAAGAGAAAYELPLRARAWKEHAHSLRLVKTPLRALEVIRHAASLFGTGAGYPIERADVTLTEALVHRDLGNHSAALWCISVADAVYDACGDVVRHNMARELEAAVYYDQSQYARAEAVYQETLEVAELMNDAAGVARSLSNLAACAAKRKDVDAAAKLYQRAIGALEALGMTAEVERARINHAEIMAHQQEMEQALRELIRVRDSFLARGMRLDAADVTLKLVELLAANGRAEAAAPHCSELVTIFSEAGMVHEALIALAYLKDGVVADDVTLPAISDETLQAALGTELFDTGQVLQDMADTIGMPEDEIRRHLALLETLTGGEMVRPDALTRLFAMWRSAVSVRIVEGGRYLASRAVLRAEPGFDVALTTALTRLRQNPHGAAPVSDASPVRTLRVHGTATSPAIRLYYVIEEDESVRLMEVEFWTPGGAGGN
ncbi:MAG TPA: tetratricopeptide repeat protein [Thermoanaerobaculia bacterium]|jgi:tetratricopeptide (TPR) repeat protein